jgi:hypothetical protein
MSEEQKFVEVSLSSFSFSDSDLSEIKNDSEKFIDENSSFSNPRIPICYPEKGRFEVRIHPDRDKNGKIRYFKRCFTNQIISKDNKRFNVCSDERIEQALKTAESNGFKDAWKYKSRENIIMLARFVSCPEDKYFKAGSDVLFVLDKVQASKIIEFFNSLSIDQLKNSLNIKKPYYCIEIVFEKSKYKTVSSIKFTSNQLGFETMVLPSGYEWKGLDQAYISEENNTVTTEQLIAFKKFLSRETYMEEGLKEPENKLSDPLDSIDDHIPYEKFTPTSSNNEEKCEIIKEKQNNQTNGWVDVKFGFPPENKEDNYYCTICPNSVSCGNKKSI